MATGCHFALKPISYHDKASNFKSEEFIKIARPTITGSLKQGKSNSGDLLHFQPNVVAQMSIGEPKLLKFELVVV